MFPVSEDWLALSIRLLDRVGNAPKRHRWREYEGGTNVWRRRLVLFNEYGEKVLTLLYDPKSTGFLSPDAALVEVANEWLYHGGGIRMVLAKLQVSVPYEVIGISRFDMACDFVPDECTAQIIRELANGSIYVQGKRSGSSFWSVNQDDWMPPMWRGERIPHCISWGHKSTAVKWKLYYKSRELREQSHGAAFDKPYIVDLWRECNLDVNNVWRLEVSIHHASQLLYLGAPLTWDVAANNTLDLFCALYSSRFVLRRNEGHKDKTNDSIVPFLSAKSTSVIKCRQYDGDGVRSARISLLRRLVTSLDDEEVAMDVRTRDDVLMVVDGLINRDNLGRYFLGWQGVSYGEWRDAFLDRTSDAGRRPIDRGNVPVNDLRPNIRFDDGLTNVIS